MGGGSYAALVTVTEDDNISSTVAVVGGGGEGGVAGDVIVVNSGKLQTSGGNSNAIYAQSVGGNGGGGGIGDTVTVENAGDITTYGIASYGIFARSVGGSGGNGGDGQLNLSGWVADVADIVQAINQAQTVYDDLSDPSSLFSDYQIDIGGDGGASSNGGEMDVSSTSTITTQGNDATTIFAQSVGGGGGSGGDGSQGPRDLRYGRWFRQQRRNWRCGEGDDKRHDSNHRRPAACPMSWQHWAARAIRVTVAT